MNIPLPYNLTEEQLVLDSSTIHNVTDPIMEQLEWLWGDGIKDYDRRGRAHIPRNSPTTPRNEGDDQGTAWIPQSFGSEDRSILSKPRMPI